VLAFADAAAAKVMTFLLIPSERRHAQAASDADLLSILIEDAMGGHDPRTACSFYSAGQELDPFSQDAIRATNPASADFMIS